MEVVREALAAPADSDADTPSAGGGDGPPLSAVLAPCPPLLRRLLLLLGDESGFLVERRLHRLLAGIDPEDATLLRLDAVMAALGVRTQIDLDELCRYFVRWAGRGAAQGSGEWGTECQTVLYIFSAEENA